jgi:peptide chain release factor subunit 1
MTRIARLGQGEAVVASTLSWEELRGLAGFRAENGCAVSLYVGLDPSESPTPGAVETRVNSLLAAAERKLDERRSQMQRVQREALKADIGRITAWFDDGFDRKSARGVGVFAAGLDNFWSTLHLPEPVRDDVKVAGDLYLAPLARLVGRSDGLLVAAVGRERGEVFRLSGGQLIELADETDDVPGRHDQGGWSQARYERHIDEIVERHWRRVAETLDSCLRRLAGAHVVLVGAEDMRSDFEEVLPNDVKSRLVGWTTTEAHADARALLEAVQPVVDEWRARKEAALLERWREEAGKNGRAAAGWQETLEAASDGRVELLLVQDGADEPAYQCPECGRARLTDGSCPLDGTTLESREEGFDLALHQTLRHGGTIHVVRDRHDLEPVGGVAALLRF